MTAVSPAIVLPKGVQASPFAPLGRVERANAFHLICHDDMVTTLQELRNENLLLRRQVRSLMIENDSLKSTLFEQETLLAVSRSSEESKVSNSSDSVCESDATQKPLIAINRRFQELYTTSESMTVEVGHDGFCTLTAASIEFVHWVVCVARRPRGAENDDDSGGSDDDDDPVIFWFSADFRHRLSLPLFRVSSVLERLCVVVWATKTKRVETAPMSALLSVIGQNWSLHTNFYVKQAHW
jgi:hypothetical protein